LVGETVTKKGPRMNYSMYSNCLEK